MQSAMTTVDLLNYISRCREGFTARWSVGRLGGSDFAGPTIDEVVRMVGVSEIPPGGGLTFAPSFGPFPSPREGPEQSVVRWAGRCGTVRAGTASPPAPSTQLLHAPAPCYDDPASAPNCASTRRGRELNWVIPD